MWPTSRDGGARGSVGGGEKGMEGGIRDPGDGRGYYKTLLSVCTVLVGVDRRCAGSDAESGVICKCVCGCDDARLARSSWHG